MLAQVKVNSLLQVKKVDEPPLLVLESKLIEMKEPSLTKKECLNSKYYTNFSLFSGAISAFLTSMDRTHKKQLDSLLTLKFQLFTEEQVQKNCECRFARPTLRSLPTESDLDVNIGSTAQVAGRNVQNENRALQKVA